VSSVSARIQNIYKVPLMKRIIGALRAKLSRPKSPVVDDHSSHVVSVDEVSMPDIYGDEDDVIVPRLRMIDPSSPDIDKLAGFNPYDTAVLQKKK
jgi:hypothetical protein